MIVGSRVVIGADDGRGRGAVPDVLGWAPVPRSGLGSWVVGTVSVGSAGVQGLEPVPGGGEVGGPGPAGRNLQDSSSGVGDEAGRGRQQPEPQGLGGGLGQPVEGEVAQPRGQRGGQRGQLQPGGVAVVVDGGYLESLDRGP